MSGAHFEVRIPALPIDPSGEGSLVPHGRRVSKWVPETGDGVPFA